MTEGFLGNIVSNVCQQPEVRWRQGLIYVSVDQRGHHDSVAFLTVFLSPGLNPLEAIHGYLMASAPPNLY